VASRRSPAVDVHCLSLLLPCLGVPSAHCAANEKKAVGGVKGGESRKQQMADEAGGDVHAAYSEMGSKVTTAGGVQDCSCSLH
jgi:hypothetical protein